MITNHFKTVAGLFISHFLIPTCTSNVPHFHFLSSLACVHSCERPDTWSSSWEILLKQICHSWNLIHGLERPRRTGKRRAVTTCQFRGHSFVPVRHSSPLFQGAFCPLSHHLPCLVNLQSLIALHLDAWLKIARTLTHKIPTVLLRAWTQRSTPDKLSVCLCVCQVNHGLWELMIQGGRLCSLVAASSDIYSITRSESGCSPTFTPNFNIRLCLTEPVLSGLFPLTEIWQQITPADCLGPNTAKVLSCIQYRKVYPSFSIWPWEACKNVWVCLAVDTVMLHI